MKKGKLYACICFGNGRRCYCPRCFTKLLKPVYAQLQLLVIVYLQGQTCESCQKDIERTVELFRTLGFTIHQFTCSVTIRSHIRRVHACFTVTRLLHFWQNDLDPLRAAMVTRRRNGYRSSTESWPREANSPAASVGTRAQDLLITSLTPPLSYPCFACFSLIMKITCAKSNLSG